jgi:uncharacterized RDD family membrane protein YckC
MNEQPASTPAPTPAQNVTGSRIVAGIIDVILLGIVFIILSALFGDSESSSGDDGSSFSVSLSGLPLILFILISFGYYFVLEAYNQGQTLGKKVMGIRVVAIEGPLDPRKVVVRTLCRVVDGFLFYLVAVIVIATSQRKQRIGDMAAGTIVVKA